MSVNKLFFFLEVWKIFNISLKGLYLRDYWRVFCIVWYLIYVYILIFFIGYIIMVYKFLEFKVKMFYNRIKGIELDKLWVFWRWS